MMEEGSLGVRAGDNNVEVEVVEGWFRGSVCRLCSEEGRVESGSKGESMLLVEGADVHCSWMLSEVKVLCDC